MAAPWYIRKNLAQTFVYWGNPTVGGTGTITFDAPVEISGRYEMKNEVVVEHSGEERVAGGHAWLNQDTDVGGYLYLGSLTDSDMPSDPSDPRLIEGAMRIIVKAQFPRLGSSTEFLYRAHLNMDEE